MSTSWLAFVRHPAPDDLELWLEHKAAQGKQLAGVDRLSALRMKFTSTEPAKVRYVLDQRAQPTPADYFTFREARGWQHVGSTGTVHVWQQTYTGERPEGLIGAEGLSRRANAWRLALSVVAVVGLLLAVTLGILAGTDSVAAGIERDYWAPAIAFGVLGLIAAAASIQLGLSQRLANRRTARLAAEAQKAPATVG